MGVVEYVVQRIRAVLDKARRLTPRRVVAVVVFGFSLRVLTPHAEHVGMEYV